MEHYYFLKEQLKNYLDTDFFDLNHEMMDIEKENIFEERRKSEHISEILTESNIPDITILRMAYLIEKDYGEFYRNAAEKVQNEDAEVIFEKMAKWEEGHEKIFREEYDRRMKEYMNLPWGGKKCLG